MKKIILGVALVLLLTGCKKDIHIDQEETGSQLRNAGYIYKEENQCFNYYVGGSIIDESVVVVNVIHNVPEKKKDEVYKKFQEMHGRYKKTISTNSTISEYNYDLMYVTVINDDDCVIEIAGSGNEYLKVRLLYLKNYPDLI